MTDDPGWYADVADALREKPLADIAREIPGLVNHLAETANVDHYVVGVSFSKGHAGLDNAVDRVRESGDDRVVEPASERPEYVHFAHPPDPHFDAAALRARLLAAVGRERRRAAESDAPESPFAELWKPL